MFDFADEQPLGWETLAKNFIFEQKNQRASRIIKTIKQYKLDTEAKLKQLIDKRIFAMKESRL